MNKYWLTLFMAVLISTCSQLLLKRATLRQRKGFLADYLNPWVISGYMLMVISTLCIILAYRGVDYKNGPVVESLGFVLVMIFGKVFFKEKLSCKKAAGMALVLTGIAVFYLL